MTIAKVDNNDVYRLMGIGATVLVGTADGEDRDVMTAAWACALDYDKVSVVIASDHYTRKLMEKTGRFAIEIPTQGIAKVAMSLGSVSKNDDAAKIEKSGAEFIDLGSDLPMVKGCAAWIECEVIENEDARVKNDLFLGRVVNAWADDRVFKDGHWIFENADDSLRTLHYVAGGRFYVIGKAIDVE